MLLAVDIGNTNIVFGCVDENDNIPVFERISTNHNATATEYACILYTFIYFSWLIEVLLNLLYHIFFSKSIDLKKFL